MIIKKVFVAGAPKSRLSFANVGSKQSPQELIKLKGIVQKYLIAINWSPLNTKHNKLWIMKYK